MGVGCSSIGSVSAFEAVGRRIDPSQLSLGPTQKKTLHILKNLLNFQGLKKVTCGFNLRRGAHSHPLFEVQTLNIIEIINFNDLNIDSYVFDNSKTEY